MKRKQNKEGVDMTEEGIVTKIYEELKSRSFVEQLRLECIADVKKKHTYLKLRERITDYLTRKMCSSSWTTDGFDTDVFREQVVECGVLVLTVERIVDAIVTRKLHEELKPMISEIVNEFCNRKMPPPQKSRIQKAARSSQVTNSGFEETARLVEKICNDTQRDSKKIFEDSFISKSLARAQDSEDDVSDLSSDDEHYASGGDKDGVVTKPPKKKRLVVPKIVVKEDESCIRGKRERKLNPKYSPSLYQTSLSANNFANGHVASTNGDAHSNGVRESPVKNSVKDKPRPSKGTEAFLTNGTTRLEQVKIETKEIEEEDISKIVAKKSSPKLLVSSGVRGSASNRRNPVTSMPERSPNPKLNATEEVRKSGRPRKLNSLIFCDTLSESATMLSSVFARKSSPHREESVKDINIKREIEEVEEEQSKELSADQSSKMDSRKRYDTSDLYKPRPVIQSTGSRSRRM